MRESERVVQVWKPSSRTSANTHLERDMSEGNGRGRHAGEECGRVWRAAHERGRQTEPAAEEESSSSHRGCRGGEGEPAAGVRSRRGEKKRGFPGLWCHRVEASTTKLTPDCPGLAWSLSRQWCYRTLIQTVSLTVWAAAQLLAGIIIPRMWGIPFPTERVIEVTQFLTVINQSRVRKKKNPKTSMWVILYRLRTSSRTLKTTLDGKTNQMTKIRFAAHTVSIDVS